MVSLLVLVGGILVVIWLAVVAAIVWVVVGVGIVVVGSSSCCRGGILLLLSLLLSLPVALLLVSWWSGWFVSTTSTASGGILLRRLMEWRIGGWLLLSSQLKVSGRATAWARMVSIVSAPLGVILPVRLISASCSEVRSEPACLAASEVSTAWSVHDWMVVGVRPKGGSRLLFLFSHQLVEGLV